MADLCLSYTHSLKQDEALRRVKTLIQRLVQVHGDPDCDVQVGWDGNQGGLSFHMGGHQICSRITVTDKQVIINTKVSPLIKSRFELLLSDEMTALLQAQTA